MNPIVRPLRRAWHSEALRSRLRIARLLLDVAPATALALAAFNLVLGALPILFIIATSVVLVRIGEITTGGEVDVVVPFLVSAGAFSAHQALTPLQTALGELVARRIDGWVFHRLMAAALEPTGIAALEDQSVRDDLNEAVRELEFNAHSPGRAAAGLLALIARYTQLTGYGLVIAWAFTWWAAIGVMLTCLMFRQGQRGGLRRYARVFGLMARPLREGQYLRDLALGSKAGKELRIFGLVGWLTDRYRAAANTWLERVWSERRRIYGVPYLWYTGVGVAVIGMILAAVGATAEGDAPLAELSLVLLCVVQSARLGEFYPECDVQTQYGMISYEATRAFEQRLSALHSEDSPYPSEAVAVPRSEETIEFCSVSFTYDGAERAVFERINLTIRPGRCTAIVGLNGAGKTTLVKLLTRLYEPSAGRIRVGGLDIESVPVERHRKRISVVFQDFLRYEGTVAENIAYGSVAHLDDRAGIVRAAEAAGIGDAVNRLPRRYDTVLAPHLEGGVDLSGGQWQRVAIARTLFAIEHGASIVVLDEPTANLDLLAEVRFFHEFRELALGVTTVLISHRFPTVRHADDIVVLDGGRVAEQGDHTSLMEADGLYAALFREQAAKFTDVAQEAK